MSENESYKVDLSQSKHKSIRWVDLPEERRNNIIVRKRLEKIIYGKS